jgi:chemotaxis signal transduction protein
VPNEESIKNPRQQQVSPLDKLLLLRLGSLKLAVDSDQVLATCEWLVPTPLPFAPEPVKGIISIDGRMFTVLEIGQLFGEVPSGARKAIVVFRGDEQLALAIDSAETEVEVSGNDISNAPEGVARTIRGVWHHNGEQIQVLQINELFSSAIQGRERRRRRL